MAWWEEKNPRPVKRPTFYPKELVLEYYGYLEHAVLKQHCVILGSHEPHVPNRSPATGSDKPHQVLDRHTWPVAPPGEHRENISIPTERSPDSTALKGNTVPAMGWSYASYNTLPCSYSTNTSSSHYSHCHDVLAGLEASKHVVHAHACLHNTQAHMPLPHHTHMLAHMYPCMYICQPCIKHTHMFMHTHMQAHWLVDIPRPALCNYSTKG